MLNSMIIGRYIPIDSFVHRLDPRAKLLATFFYLIIVFLANNWQTYLILAIFVLMGVALSKIPLRYFIRGVRPMLVLILITVLLQVFFTYGETVYWQWGILVLSREGIINGIFIFLRFMLIIFMSTLLTLTTTPIELTDAIEFVLRPLKVINVPVHAIALMLSIALRFVPTLMDETQKIMNAQRSRGVDFSEGNVMQRMQNIVPLLVPLFVASFNSALDLAVAMEARGYSGDEKRTRFRELTWSGADTMVMLACLVLLILILFLRQ